MTYKNKGSCESSPPYSSSSLKTTSSGHVRFKQDMKAEAGTINKSIFFDKGIKQHNIMLRIFLMHICDMSHAYVTYSYVRHDIQICVT